MEKEATGSVDPRYLEIVKLRRGLWDAWASLGYDTDGNTGPGALIAGMGVEGFIEMVVSDARAYREESEQDYAKDTDELKAEIAAQRVILDKIRAEGEHCANVTYQDDLGDLQREVGKKLLAIVNGTIDETEVGKKLRSIADETKPTS